MDADFNYQNFRDSFLGILQGMLTHNGLMMADEGHFRTMVGNAEGLALAAERVMRKHVPSEPKPKNRGA